MVGVSPIRVNVTQEVGFDNFDRNTNIPRAATYRMNPLHELLWFEDEGGIKAFIENTEPAELKRVLREQDRDGRSPLMYAIVSRKIPLVKLLLDADAPVNYATDQGYTPLFYAIYHDGREIVDMLLQKEAKVNIVSKGRVPITPLQFACARGQVQTVAKLLQAEAEVEVYYESQGEKFNTLMLTLHSAEIEAAPVREAICELLLDHGANTSTLRSDGCTSLICAIDHGLTDFVKLLLERDLARPERIAADKCTTALWVCLHKKNLEVMKLLLKRDVPADTGKSRSSPLHAAVISDFVEGVKACLELKVQPMWMDQAGFTSLHYAACLKNTACLKLLLEKGNLNIEVPAKRSGFTPLVVACLKGNIPGIEALLEAGAKLETYDKKDGITPLIATMINNHVEACNFLIAKGADIMGRRAGCGMTPLMNAIGLQRDAIRDAISERAKDIGKKGELKKQGGGHRSKAWKKRFFVLHGTYCFYYKTEKQPVPQGIIILDNAKIEPSPKGGFAFQIVTPARIYQVKADNEEIRNDWFTSLTDACNSYQPEQKPSQTFTIEGKAPELRS